MGSGIGGIGSGVVSGDHPRKLAAEQGGGRGCEQQVAAGSCAQ